MEHFPMQVRVAAVDQAADRIRVLRLMPAQGGTLPAWEPGAHLEVLLPGDLRRQYSLCGARADRAEWTIGVLHEPAGRGGSAHLHERVGVGDLITVTGVRNLFPLAPAPEYLFVAGGIGITPILAMIEAAEEAGARWRLLYGGRRLSTMAFVDDLGVYGDRIELYPQDERGLIDPRAALAQASPGTRVYACGPEPLLRALADEVARAGLTLHVERFAVPAEAGDQATSTAFEVELATSGTVVQVPADRSIVEVLRSSGVEVATSCGEGICGTCEVAVLAGTPDHRDQLLDEEERSAGRTMMPCVSRSRSPRLVLDL